MSSAHGSAGGRIVVGVDGSLASIEALRWAARLATMNDSTIQAVLAWRYPMAYGWTAPPPDWYPREDARRMLADAVKHAFDDQRPEKLQLSVVEGNPVKVLLEKSAKADILVVGSRGHGGFTGLLIGSVSAQCAEHATCPVLVVHHPAESAAA